MFGKVTGTIAYKTFGVGRDLQTKQAIVKATNAPRIAHNQTNAANWQGDLSNNGLFTGMRERFLRDPNSPQTQKMRAGQMGPATPTETQQGIGNRFNGYRQNVKLAQENTKKNIAELEGHLAKERLSSKTKPDTIAAYEQSIRDAKRQSTSLGTQHLTSYVKQAGAHAMRLGKWTQEGSAYDRALKTGAVAGTMFGASVGMRALNGGGVTYNNKGERDIAGIPFL